MPIESENKPRLVITVEGDSVDHFRSAVKKLVGSSGFTRVQLEKEEQEAMDSLNKVINPEK